jgi:hypothetical protein
VKRKYWLLLLISLLLINIGCSNKSSNESSDDNEYYSEENGYEDGTYCAEVTYYNQNTGTRNTYTLEVEVESNELVKIYWNNGGWLDEDHFNAQELDNDGTCSFTSDKEYEYNIEITGKDCINKDNASFQNDLEEDKRKITCSKCGGKKNNYDAYCDDCQDKFEHTCKRCGQVDNFMFSTDDYCSDCENKLENTCSQCGGYEYAINGGICASCKSNDE